MCLSVGDVDQLTEIPLAGEPRGDGLKVGRRVARQVARGSTARQAGRPGSRCVVDEQPPDLLERTLPDEILDIDAAVAKRAAVAVGLGDLGLERNNALEAGLELAHRSPRSTRTRSPLTLPERGRMGSALCSAAWRTLSP